MSVRRGEGVLQGYARSDAEDLQFLVFIGCLGACRADPFD